MDLYLVSRVDVFAIYPKILKELLQAEEEEQLGLDEKKLIKDFINLPSDGDFQERVYYRLLAVQKRINKLLESGVPLDEIIAPRDKSIWDPDENENLPSPQTTTPQSGETVKLRICRQDLPLEYVDTNNFNIWSLEDLTKAAKLLHKPPMPCGFYDEHEMRRVYSIVYDVFRYKHVLSQALHDVGFFGEYPDLKNDKNRLWLLLYDLYLRHFLKREPSDRIKQKFFYSDANLETIHNSIWKYRIHLAASISRLRIQNSALNLSDLLPLHLQDEKVALAAANPIVTGWLNPFKIRTKDGARQCMIGSGFIELRDIFVDNDEILEEERRLEMNYFKWDKVCPLFLSCIPPDRSHFAKSDVVKRNQLVMQDRAFSIGPAIFSRLLEYFDIEGDVVQTHVLSPRSTAYLAALFHCNNRVSKLIAFGAGGRLNEYKQFFHQLGCDNVTIYADNFVNVPIESSIMDKVVGIFVTPPNSYSAVTDPIDLICSRGGDLAMLQILTESEMSDESKKRVARILEEQREALRLAMSRPQVQYVLYETHSVVEAENELMVKRTIENVNDSAYMKHLKLYKERRRLELLAEQEGLTNEQYANLSAAVKKKPKTEEKKIAYDSEESSTDFESDTELIETPRSRLPKLSMDSEQEHFYLKIPKTDMFETVDLPDFCMNQDKCVNLKELGCYVSLLKRKGLIRLDEKYLISMAEKRGLFGEVGSKKARSRPQTRSSKREEKQKPAKKVKRRKNDNINDLIDRLSKPTYASKRHQMPAKSSVVSKLLVHSPNKCKCHMPSIEEFSDGSTILSSITEAKAKRWWNATSRYVKSLNLLSIPESDRREQIFERVRSNKIPALNLPRHLPFFDRSPRHKYYEKDPFPVTTNYLQFCEYREPEPSFANIPMYVEDMTKIPMTIHRPSYQKFKPLGFVNLKDMFYL